MAQLPDQTDQLDAGPGPLTRPDGIDTGTRKDDARLGRCTSDVQQPLWLPSQTLETDSFPRQAARYGSSWRFCGMRPVRLRLNGATISTSQIGRPVHRNDHQK